MITFLIVFAAFLGLIILHELSHFIAAKKIGVNVEEFGIGYPPKILGKKIGNTIYSLNLLPFGAFVRIDDEKLAQKPIWQRAAILLAGVFSFWIIAAVLLSLIFYIGSPFQITDNEDGSLVNPRV